MVSAETRRAAECSVRISTENRSVSITPEMSETSPRFQIRPGTTATSVGSRCVWRRVARARRTPPPRTWATPDRRSELRFATYPVSISRPPASLTLLICFLPLATISSRINIAITPLAVGNLCVMFVCSGSASVAAMAPPGQAAAQAGPPRRGSASKDPPARLKKWGGHRSAVVALLFLFVINGQCEGFLSAEALYLFVESIRVRGAIGWVEIFAGGIVSVRAVMGTERFVFWCRCVYCT